MRCPRCRTLCHPADADCFGCGAPRTVPAPAPATEDATLRPPGRGLLYWGGQVLLFPLRVFCIVVLVSVLFGIGPMLRLPWLARDNQVDLTLLTLQASEPDKAVRPFAALGYTQDVQPHILRLNQGWEGDGTVAKSWQESRTRLRRLSKVQARRLPNGGFRYSAEYTDGNSQDLETTTPRTTVPPAEIARARQAVARLFPHRADFETTLRWGRRIFSEVWWRQNMDHDVPEPLLAELPPSTEDEWAWVAWRVLCGPDTAVADDLFRLPELFRQAFPEPKDQQAALAWARDFYQRQEEGAAAYDAVYSLRPDRGAIGAPAPGVQGPLRQVLPARTEWTYLWLLHRFVGLTEAAQTAARTRWLNKFPSHAEPRVLAMGRRLTAQRRAAGESLPPVPEVLPLLCVVERLTGSDPHGHRCRTASLRAFGGGDAGLRDALNSVYPSDEFYFLVASADALEMVPFTPQGPKNGRFFAPIILTLLVAFGVSTVLSGITAVAFTKTTRPLWERHEAARGKESWGLWALGVLVFGTVGALLAPHTLPDAVAVQMSHFSEALLASLTGMIIGGLFIGTIRRTLAVLLVAWGVDLEATWADEILGLLVGGLILAYFGNGLVLLFLYGLTDFFPLATTTAYRALRARREAPVPQPAGV